MMRELMFPQRDSHPFAAQAPPPYPLCHPVPPPASAPIRNAFAPVVFDWAHSSPGGGCVSAPLHLRNGNGYPVLGQQSMTLRAGSGDVGFIATRIMASAWNGYVRMGLAVRDVSLTSRLGDSVGALAWWQDGDILNRFTTLLPATDGSVWVKTHAKFRVGDTVGLMVDCRAAPQLRLFVNGVQRAALALTPGTTVFPAWAVLGGPKARVYDSVVAVEGNPAVPKDDEVIFDEAIDDGEVIGGGGPPAGGGRPPAPVRKTKVVCCDCTCNTLIVSLRFSS